MRAYPLMAALLAVSLLLVGVAATTSAAESMSVQVKSGSIRTSPSFLAKIVAQVQYGDRVAVLSQSNGWAEVKIASSGLQGWIHASALTTEKIELRAGEGNVAQSASSDELALAGKGFNAQVEKEYKAKNPKVSFAWVDKMEKMTVSDETIREFIQIGGLKTPGGAP
jgi:uncharacterized protein YgiM (DUF1202 family)